MTTLSPAAAAPRRRVLCALLLMPLAACAIALLPVGDAHARAHSQPGALSQGTMHDLSPTLAGRPASAYEGSVRSEQTIALMGQTQELENAMRFRVAIAAPMPRAHGGATAEATFEQLAVEVKGGPAPGEFDSAKPARTNVDLYESICRPLVGKPLTLMLAPDGTIESVDGLAKLAPEGRAGQLFLMLFSEDAVRSMLQPIFKVKSAGGEGGASAAVGGRWTETTPGARGLGLRGLTLEMVLQTVRGSTAIITISGEPDDTPPPDVRALPDLKVTESTVDGEARWNLRRGALQAYTSESTLRMESSGQLSVSVTANSASELRRVK
jgi:hypothetical protein